MLVRFLEDTLSSDDRYISVRGVTGALSSRATIEEIAVSDDDGVWLRITGAVLDWNRLALVRGRFSVNSLAADEIEIARTPKPVPADPEIPTAEAQPFQLPELPVAIEIGEIRVDKISLGEPLIGVAAELSLKGAVSLANGALDSNLAITRLDRPGDEIDLIAKFENETSEITVDLKAIEDQGGLISTVLKIPDSPPLLLTVKGSGPVTQFAADISLATDDAQRLAGTVKLEGVPTPDTPEDQPSNSIAFTADLSGDVTPMLPEDYREFFGSKTLLSVEGRSDPDGRLAINTLDLSSNALSLQGQVSLAPGGVIEKVQLDGDILPPSGDSVLLPLSPRTTLGSALFTVQLDKAAGDDWNLILTADKLNRPDLTLEQAQVLANGKLTQDDGLNLQGSIRAGLTALVFADEKLNTAVGEDITLNGFFALDKDKTLDLKGFELIGTDYTATVDGEVAGLDSGFEMDGVMRIGAADLSRFSGLAGRDLAGSVNAELDGKGAPLGGSFDFKLDVLGRDLKAGIDQVDALIAGQTNLSLDAKRSETGLDIRDFVLNGSALSAKAKGQLASTDSALTFQAAIDNLGRVLPQVSGPLTLNGDVKQDGTAWDGDVSLKGPHSSFADLTGRFDPKGTTDVDFEAAFSQLERFVPQLEGAMSAKGNLKQTDGIWTADASIKGPHTSFADLKGTLDPAGTADIDFDAAFSEIERFVPQIRGTLTAKGNAKQTDGIWTADAALKGPDSSFADLKGTIDPKGKADLIFDAAFNGLERFVPELVGTLTAKGTAQRDGTLWTIKTDATGPGAIEANVAGTYDQTAGTADVDATGQLRLDTANLFISPNQVAGLAKFDMSLNGKPSLQALSGTITTSGTTLAIPSVAQAIENIGATVAIRDSQASVNVTGNLRAGGGFKVQGPVALTPPFDGRIAVDLVNLILTDNVSFTSSANGQIVMAGPLTGGANIAGQVTFGETNINLNAISGGVGAAPIPPIRHISEPSAAFTTRERAGLVQTDSGGGGGAGFGLDIALLAPNRVFATGFGLQAELGGALQIGGTTTNVAPSGQIELIRGTLDLIGRRLELTKGIVSLQGDLSPYVDFESSTTTSDGQATFQIEGPISAPVVSVTADPERPPEEALAMLLFGNRFSQLSPFVIAQMAASLAAMSGSGGGTKAGIKDATGVDTLDIGTDAGGNGKVGAGAYIADNIYTDVTVNTRGETELNLNLDVTDSLTLRGTVDSTGESGIGVYFERDY
ncbi:translocation/assembly module TamB domain-containing protein [Phaeobacter marinintestinus]|uniref:translocation/assembly module TamB domain-containing protein n=1 Tax=Falsiphaeobacter marinintestinus TaxID=1492905 RepID=UPI0011B7598E|nr:translocation/assembly module TamB domain-containing protein [Phaeobacter marinintestinus]